MATMTIRIPDAKHERLRLLAERHGTSLNKLVEEWANVALAQHDAEARFRVVPKSASAKGKVMLKFPRCIFAQEAEARADESVLGFHLSLMGRFAREPSSYGRTHRR